MGAICYPCEHTYHEVHRKSFSIQMDLITDRIIKVLTLVLPMVIRITDPATTGTTITDITMADELILFHTIIFYSSFLVPFYF